MNEDKPAEKPKKLFLTKEPKPAINFVVDPLEALDKFLILDMNFRARCAVTQINSTITLTGTVDNLLYVLTQSAIVRSPHFLTIDPYEKAEVEAELNRLKPKTTNTLGKSLGFFSLNAKWTGRKDGATNTKKKSSSAERRRSSSMSLAEPRRASAPNPADMDIIGQPHNTSPATPAKK